jgi:TonB-linked SusC/RagA family outer membrane protein
MLNFYRICKSYRFLRTVFVQVVCILLITITVSAGNTNAQNLLDKKVTLRVSAVPLSKVIDMLQAQTKINIVYSPSTINIKQEISFNGVDVKLKDFFDRVFVPMSIKYRIIENKIVLYTDAGNERLQVTGLQYDEVIKGRVTDNKGDALSGVSIRVVGTSQGVFSDEEGNFTLTVASIPVQLEFSHISYAAKVMQVTTNTITVSLDNPIVKTDEEVVVTALGISRPNRKIGYATTKVDGALLSQAKEPNVANSLQGRVPGLNISGVNSGPGGSARILIRGISNFTSTTGPLIVIDGVPMDNTQKGSPGVYGGQDMGDGISSINPDDIENIVVLKGSTASALYGTRASNGVLQITTKSGKGANGFGVEFNSNFSINSIIDNSDFQQVYGHGLNGQRPTSLSELTAANINSWGEKLDRQPSVAMDGNMYPYAAVENQKQKFYRVAPVATNTISFVNGGPNGNLRFSLSHMNNESVLPNSNLRRYSGNLNLNQNITQKLKLMLVATYTDEAVKLRPLLNDMSRNANFAVNLLPANINPEYLKPGYNLSNGYENAMNSDGYMANPWFVVERTISNTWRKRFISSVALKYDVLKNLYVQVRTGYDLINDDVFSVEPTGQGYLRSGKLGEKSKATNTELNVDAMAGYNTKLGSDFNLDLGLGGNIRKYAYEKIGIEGGTGWKQPFLYTPSNLLTTPNPIYPSPYRGQTNSAYYTADVSFRNFLTLNTTGRYDEFSTVNTGIFTPSVSGSFIFTDVVDIKDINYGKLRISYAQTSGEATPFSNRTYYVIENGSNSNRPFGSMANETVAEDIKPYRMQEYEIGLELQAFKRRVGLDITYFSRKTENELIRKQLSVASGYQFSYEPLGITQNNGIELNLTGDIVRGKDFNWKSSFNITWVKNKLVKIDNNEDPGPLRKDGEGQYRAAVGPYSNGAFIASVQGLPIAQIMAYDFRYDSKGQIVVGADGIPLRGELKAMGSGLPKFYGGFNNDFTYKKFNFSVLFDYKFGNKVLSGTDFMSYYYGLNKKTLEGRETGVVAKGVYTDGTPNASLVNAQDYYKGLVTNVSTISVFDGSFIKLRQIGLGYLFTPDFLGKTPFQAINVSLVARNLFTLLKYTDNFDPEDTFSSLPGNAGLEGGGLPQTRTYGINVNIKFRK